MATRSGLVDCSDWVDVIVVYLRLDYGERRRRGASAVRRDPVGTEPAGSQIDWLDRCGQRRRAEAPHQGRRRTVLLEGADALQEQLGEGLDVDRGGDLAVGLRWLVGPEQVGDGDSPGDLAGGLDGDVRGAPGDQVRPGDDGDRERVVQRAAAVLAQVARPGALGVVDPVLRGRAGERAEGATARGHPPGVLAGQAHLDGDVQTVAATPAAA